MQAFIDKPVTAAQLLAPNVKMKVELEETEDNTQARSCELKDLTCSDEHTAEMNDKGGREKQRTTFGADWTEAEEVESIRYMEELAARRKLTKDSARFSLYHPRTPSSDSVSSSIAISATQSNLDRNSVSWKHSKSLCCSESESKEEEEVYLNCLSIGGLRSSETKFSLLVNKGIMGPYDEKTDISNKTPRRHMDNSVAKEPEAVSDALNSDKNERWRNIRVHAEPYCWPHQGSRWGGINPNNTALVVIDMQKDFLSPYGYLAQQGADTKAARSIIPQIQKLLESFRKLSFPIYHTREGHRRGLSTMSSQQTYRSRHANSSGLGMGDRGPLGRLLVRGEEGHDIVDEVKPYEGDEDGLGEEPVIDKPARSAFGYTDFQLLLDIRGVRNLIICGVTTDQCVLSTMRDANDKGYDCLLVSDASWAEPLTHTATLEMVKAEGGILGAVSTTDEILKAIHCGFSPSTIATFPTSSQTPSFY